jgi:hypothetical protein
VAQLSGVETVTVIESLHSRRRESEEKPKYAQGLADGWAACEWGLSVTSDLGAGIDEYCKGFRAGYCGKDRRAAQTQPENHNG